MQFTSKPPDKPGFYAWKATNKGFIDLVDIQRRDLDVIETEFNKGEWCPLLPAEEIEDLQRELTLLKSNMKKVVEKAFREGVKAATTCGWTTDENLWLQSNARKVVEGGV